MIWLLKLYPPGWRRRYGAELTDLVGAQRFSLATVIDVVAGAIDAWVHPQTPALVHPSAQKTRAGGPAVRDAPAGKGEEKMLAMMKFRCGGYGPNVTSSDQWKSVAVTLGATVMLTLGWMWLHIRIGDNPYVDSLSLLPIMAGLLVGMRYTYLKGRSAMTQAIFIGGNLCLLAALFLAAGWVAARL